MMEMPPIDSLKELLREGRAEELRPAFEEAHPHDLAELLHQLDDDQAWRALGLVPQAWRPEVFSHLPIERQSELVKRAELKEAVRLLERMAPDDRADLIEALEPPRRDQLLDEMRPPEREITEQLTRYPEDSVGTVMSTDFAALSDDKTMDEAIQLLRLQAPRKETIYYAYVMDPQSRLIGFVSLKDIILARADQRVGDIMEREVISVRVDDDRTVAAGKIKDYDLIALPVVDAEGRLLGIVTVDDVIDVEEEEVTEDFHKLGGLTTLHHPYLTTKIATMVRKRVGWLAILFGAGLFTVAAMGTFEEQIDRLPVLAVFVPLIIATGGNSGFQAATVMTRAIALREVEPEDFGRVFAREMLGGLMLGLTLAAIGFVMATGVGMWMHAGETHLPVEPSDVGVAVGLAVVGVVLFGNMIGSMLPFILLKAGLDPATGSTPFVATVVDVVGLLIYFTIATWWLDDRIRLAADVALGH